MSKTFGFRGSQSTPVLESVPSFVSKEKSLLRARMFGKGRKTSLLGHNFGVHQYYSVTYCNHCHNVLYGVAPQGYQCSGNPI